MTSAQPAPEPTAAASLPPSADLQSLIGVEAARPAWRRPSRWLLAAAVLLLLAGLWWWQTSRTAAAPVHYVTEPVTRGRLVVTITATGTLQPTNKADIGSELSGTVARVLVDVNDRVKKGQVLAELDTTKLRDQVQRSRALLSVAQAKVRQAHATVGEAQGNLARLEQVARLSGGKVPSQAEMAAAQAALERAQADEASARASVLDAQAAVSVDETNLRKAAIRSPINGVVLARSVDPGNAVAASLQAVTLFTLAEDLSQMKLQVNVDEADVGHVREGQKAEFTVSAYPNRKYPATVTRVSYGGTTKDNVVTYVTELRVANDDLSLRPGMTATAVIAAAQRDQVLLVPNAALRFTPAAAPAAAGASASGGGLVAKLFPRPMRQGSRRPGAGAGASAAGARQVWILRDGQVVPVAVVAGASDGRMTEVSSERLEPGMAVIVEQSRASAK